MTSLSPSKANLSLLCDQIFTKLKQLCYSSPLLFSPFDTNRTQFCCHYSKSQTSSPKLVSIISLQPSLHRIGQLLTLPGLDDDSGPVRCATGEVTRAIAITGASQHSDLSLTQVISHSWRDWRQNNRPP